MLVQGQTSAYWQGQTAKGVRDVAWSYVKPTIECSRMAGMIAFFTERVETIFIDSVDQIKTWTPSELAYGGDLLLANRHEAHVATTCFNQMVMSDLAFGLRPRCRCGHPCCKVVAGEIRDLLDRSACFGNSG